MTTLAYDSFTRTVNPGYGTATSGQVYTTTGTTTAVSVTGTRLNIALATNGTKNAFMSTLPIVDTDITLTFQADKISDGTANFVPSLIARKVDSTNYYDFRVTVTPITGAVSIRISRANLGFVTSAFTWGTFVPNTDYKMRFQAIGTSPTILRGKMWDASTAEPSWQVSGSDSNSPLQAAAYPGFQFVLGAGSTNGPVVVKADDLLVTDGADPIVPTIVHAGTYDFTSTTLGVGVKATGFAGTLKVGATPQGGGTTIYSGNVTPDANKWAHMRVTGLTPGTKYDLAVIDNSTTTTVKTLTAGTLNPAPANFRAITSSCQKNTSNSPLWPEIAALNPVFFAHQGDLHYADATAESAWLAGTDDNLSASNMQTFLNTVPMSYHWDNHDWGGNSSFKTSPVSAWAPADIRNLMGAATYPDSVGLYQTWVHGGVRFVETDQWALRDEADNGTDFAVGKTMLGLTQRNWLFDTWLNAKEPVIIWFCSFPLYSTLIGNGRWGNFRDEVTIIDNWLKAHPDVKRKIVCVGGDSHSVVADDGTNTMWKLPSLNASPVDWTGTSTGPTSGTWNIARTTAAYTLTGGYYSVMDFTWEGQVCNFTWTAKAEGNVTIASWSKSFGTLPVDNIKVGSTQVDKVAVGAVTVWKKPPGTPSVVTIP